MCAHANSKPHCNTYTDGYSYSYNYGYSYCYCYCYGYGHTYTYACAYSDSATDSYAAAAAEPEDAPNSRASPSAARKLKNGEAFDGARRKQ